MTVLLPLGAPLVRYSPTGRCWLIEDGTAVPPRAATWRQAFAIAAAYVPPADARPCRGGRDAVDGRGFDGLDGPTPRSTSSSAPGSSLNPPECGGPGATSDSRAAGVVGTAARVNSSSNGAAA